MVSLNDLCDRPPVVFDDGDGSTPAATCCTWIDTPHVPTAGRPACIYDATTKTLFCGDLFTQTGAYDTDDDRDIVEPGGRGRGHVPRIGRSRPTAARAIRGSPNSTSTRSRSCTDRSSPATATPRCSRLADDIERRINAAA